MNQMSVPSVPPPMPVAFSGSRSEFFDLVKRGAGLELVTLRLLPVLARYRHPPPSVVEYRDRRRRRRIYRPGQGTAGRLPVRARDPGADLSRLFPRRHRVRALAGLRLTPLFIFFYAFGQFAIFRARRYRLTRTVWRGVRFWMDGSGWLYSLARDRCGACWCS